MLTLPVEILNLVFLMLVQRDKLECMVVCRQWNDIITQHSTLYHTIYVYQVEKLVQLISRIKGDKILGTKVDRFTLELPSPEDFDETIFSSLFPNLRDFILSGPIHLNSVRISEQPRHDHPWCKKLESITEINTHWNTKTILSSDICAKLTSISVGISDDEPVHNLIETFDNAPALKELTLYYYRVSFRDLETLHNKVPHLNSLSLNAIRLFDLTVPKNIQPALSLKKFECTFVPPDSDYDYNTYLSYLIKKYTHLEDLKLDIEYPNSENRDVDENGTDTARYGGATLLSYMKILATRLKTLSLYFDLDESEDLSTVFNFNILDASGCNIERLNLRGVVKMVSLNQLAKTNQVRNIQSLTIEWICLSDNDLFSFEWLVHFIALKELTMWVMCAHSASKYTLSLTDLMIHLNNIHLESLRLCLPGLELNYSNTTIVCHSLKELALSCVKFKQNMDIFLSQLFPNLRRLKLDGCLVKEESMIFPNLNLLYLEVVNEEVDESFPILLTTLRDGQNRVYNSGMTPYYQMTLDQEKIQYDIFTLPSMYSQPLFKSTVVPVARIVCNSVYDFLIINRR